MNWNSSFNLALIKYPAVWYLMAILVFFVYSPKHLRRVFLSLVFKTYTIDNYLELWHEDLYMYISSYWKVATCYYFFLWMKLTWSMIFPSLSVNIPHFGVFSAFFKCVYRLVFCITCRRGKKWYTLHYWWVIQKWFQFSAF